MDLRVVAFAVLLTVIAARPLSLPRATSFDEPPANAARRIAQRHEPAGQSHAAGVCRCADRVRGGVAHRDGLMVKTIARFLASS